MRLIGIITIALAINLLLSVGLTFHVQKAFADNIQEWTVSTVDSGPRHIYVYDGLVYFSEYPGNKIGRLDPITSLFNEWTVPTPNSAPAGIAVYDGLVYFTEFEGNKIGRLEPTTGIFNEWTVPTANSGPALLSVNNGLIYFTEARGNKIGCLDPDTGIFSEWTIPTPDSSPLGISVEGELVYFTESSSNKIGRLNLDSNTFTEWIVPTTDSGPRHIFVYDSKAYFTEFDGNKIGCLEPSTGTFNEWAVPTESSWPFDIFVFDDLVIFTEYSGNKIGCLDLGTSIFYEWVVPTENSVPSGIFVVENSLAYFTEFEGNKIGLLVVNHPPNPPLNLLCEGQTNPIGIKTLTPTFSWTFSDPDSEDEQSAWQIQVSTEAGGTGTMMWDSGKVAGSDSSVTYSGSTLSWGTTYHWQVKTWDNYDAEGPYCVDQTFKTISVTIVDIDVKPRNEHNKINLKSKSLLRVTILGSTSLDTSTIDPESINSEGVSIATRGSVKNPKPAFTFRDINSDTHTDLVVKFEIQALVDTGVLTSTTNTLTVAGNLYDNTPIEGTDSVNIAP